MTCFSHYLNSFIFKRNMIFNFNLNFMIIYIYYFLTYFKNIILYLLFNYNINNLKFKTYETYCIKRTIKTH